MNNNTGLYPCVPTMTTNQALVSHAGLTTLSDLLNALGFRKLCENRLSQFVPALAVHRPGKMIADLSLMLAAGGEQVSDTDQLRTAQGLFGPVASDPTFSRFFSRISKHPGAFDYAFALHAPASAGQTMGSSRQTQPRNTGIPNQSSDHRYRRVPSQRSFRQRRRQRQL